MASDPTATERLRRYLEDEEKRRLSNTPVPFSQLRPSQRDSRNKVIDPVTLEGKVIWISPQSKTYQSKKGVGEYLSFLLEDGEGKTIKLTMFNLAVNALKCSIVVGNCYRFTKCSVKKTEARYNPGTVDYEVTLNLYTRISQIEQLTPPAPVVFDDDDDELVPYLMDI